MTAATGFVGTQRTWRTLGIIALVGAAAMLGALVVLHLSAAIIGLAGFAVGLLPLWLLLGLVVPLRFAANDGVFELFGGPVTPTDLVVVAVIFRQALLLLRRGQPRFSRNAWLLVAFVVWAWIATFHASTSGTPLVRVTVYALLALTYALSDAEERRLHLVITLYAYARLATAVPYLVSGLAAAQDEIGDPHQLGFLMIAGATPLLSRELGGRWASVLAAPLLVTAAATFRRGIWFALIIVAVLVIAPRVSVKRLIALTATLTVVGLALFVPVSRFFGLEQRSYDYRKETIERGVDAASRDPIFGSGWAGLSSSQTEAEVGVGPVSVDPIAQGRSPASLPVNILASTGVLGLVLFSAYFYSMLNVLASRNRPAFLLGGAFLGLSVFGSTVDADSGVTLLFFVLVAAPAARDSLDQQARSTTPSDDWMAATRQPRPRRRQ